MAYKMQSPYNMDPNDKGRALARFAINTITSSRIGNILLPKKKMSKELKQVFKRPQIFDPSKLNKKELKEYAQKSLKDLKKRNSGKAMPTRNARAPYKMIVSNIKPSKKNKMAKLDISSLPKYKGGTAPIGRGNMLKLSKAAKKMAKAFFSRKSQQKSSPGYYTIKK